MKPWLPIVLTGTVVAATFYLWPDSENTDIPPIMSKTGSTETASPIVTKRTVDWESIIESALEQKVRFLTVTIKEKVVRDRVMEESILGIPSNARVRIIYHVEYPVGYNLEKGRYDVEKVGNVLLITLGKPELVAKPSVILNSFQVIDSGILIDEKTAMLELHQRLQPQAEKNAVNILKKSGIISTSERAFRSFIEPLLTSASEGGDLPPRIRFAYN